MERRSTEGARCTRTYRDDLGSKVRGIIDCGTCEVIVRWMTVRGVIMREKKY